MALMLESLCRIIVGIHEQSEDPQFGAREAKNRVRRSTPPKPLHWVGRATAKRLEPLDSGGAF